MKRNSILLSVCLIVLAVLAGCAEPANKFPSYAVINQPAEGFLVGQNFDNSGFTVDVYYLDGSKQTLPGASVVLQDSTDGKIKEGSTVIANLGLVNYMGEKIEPKATLTVHPFERIEVVPSVTSYAYVKGTTFPATAVTPAAADFKVNAYYKGASAPIVLSVADYEVSAISVVETDEIDSYDDLAALTEFKGTYTVNVVDAIADADTVKAAKATVEVTLTKTATPAADVTGITGFARDNKYALPAFDYSETGLPAIEPSEVLLACTMSEGDNKAYTAAELGATLSFVNADGKAFDEEFESLNLVGKSGESSVVFMQAELNGKTYGPYPVTVAYSTLSVEVGSEYKSADKSKNEIATGTAIADVKKDSFRVYLTVGTEKSLLSSSDWSISFVDIKGAALDEQVATGDSTKVQIEYKGVKADVLDFTVVPETYTYEVTDIEFAEDFAVYQITYTKAPSVTAADDVVGFTVTSTDSKGNEKETVYTSEDDDWTTTVANLTVELYSDATAKTAITTDLEDVNAVYAKAVYNDSTADVEAEGIFEVKTAVPTAVTEVSLELVYTYKLSDTPMLNSPIEWTITATTDDGTFAVDTDDSNLVVWVDNNESDLPELLTEDNFGKSIGVTYLGVDSDDGTAKELAETAQGYYEIDDIDFEFAEGTDEEFFIDQAFTNAVANYAFTEGSFAHKWVGEKEPTEDAANQPKITKVITPSSYDRIRERNNTVTIEFTYLGANGKLAKGSEEYTFEGKGYIVSEPAPVLTIDGVEASLDEDAPAVIAADTYDLNYRNIDAEVKGDVDESKAYTFSVNGAEEVTEGDPAVVTGFTIEADSTATIEVTYISANGDEVISTYYVTTVQPEAEENA